MKFESLDDEIQYWDNKDFCEILNMFVEKQSIYSANNKIKANKLFEKYMVDYLTRREKIGKKRLELYGLRNLRDYGKTHITYSERMEIDARKKRRR